MWLNKWTTGSGDALEQTDIDSAITPKGPQKPKLGWSYVGGLDLGLRRDASALVILGRHVGFCEQHEKPKKIPPQTMMMIDLGIVDAPTVEWDEHFEEGTDRLQVVYVAVWHPPRHGKVRLDAIEETIKDLDDRFSLASVGFDPWQAEYLGQRLSAQGVRVEPVTFTPQNLQSMAQCTCEAFVNKNIDIPDHRQLVQDLRQLRVVEKGYGIRLQSPRGPSGHGDAATALSIALHVSKIRLGFGARGPIIERVIAY